MSQSTVTVLPGDDVTSHIPSPRNQIKLGVGLRFEAIHKPSNNSNTNDDRKVMATCAGRLQQKNRHTWFVLQNPKRYIPQLQDRVVGVILDRAASQNGGTLYRVHLGGPHPAILSSLSFEGATKRNQPHLEPGTVVYARIQACNDQYMDPVLSCILGPRDVGVSAKDWMTNEGTYGELKGGTVTQISLGLARELLDPRNVVLEELSFLPFEVCIGVNGLLWVHSERPEYTILVINAIQNSAVLTETQVRAMVKSLAETVQKQISSEND